MSSQPSSEEVRSGAAKKRERGPGDAGMYTAIYDAILEHRPPPGTKLEVFLAGEVLEMGS